MLGYSVFNTRFGSPCTDFEAFKDPTYYIRFMSIPVIVGSIGVSYSHNAELATYKTRLLIQQKNASTHNVTVFILGNSIIYYLQKLLQGYFKNLAKGKCVMALPHT